jgi:hypothetical protein
MTGASQNALVVAVGLELRLGINDERLTSGGGIFAWGEIFQFNQPGVAHLGEFGVKRREVQIDKATAELLFTEGVKPRIEIKIGEQKALHHLFAIEVVAHPAMLFDFSADMVEKFLPFTAPSKGFEFYSQRIDVGAEETYIIECFADIAIHQ